MEEGHLNEALALVQLGSLRTLQRRTDEGLSYIHEALPFYEKGHYHKWLSQIMLLLGRAYADKGDYAAATDSFRTQLQEAELVGDLALVAFSHAEIGKLLTLQERYPE